MQSTLFPRVCGAALAIGGLIGLASLVLRPDGTAASTALSSQWVPLFTLFLMADMLITFGLVGLYVRYIERLGPLGLIAFALAFFATATSAGWGMIEAYVFPGIAALPGAPATISGFTAPDGPLPLAGQLRFFLFVIYNLGYIAISVALIWAGGEARWPGALLLLGSVVSDADIISPSLVLLFQLGMVAFSLALVWLGVLLVRGQPIAAEQAPTRYLSDTPRP